MSNDTAEKPTHKASLPWLRRSDQYAVAVLVLLGFVGTIVWWSARGGASGELVELDQAQPQEARFLVDVNRAEWPELAQLPGIGETLAQRIVESREREGPFASHDDLRRVKGIGEKKVERIRGFLLPLGGGGHSGTSTNSPQ